MTRYSYRRKLTGNELKPALAIGAGLGLGVAVVTTYLTQIFLRRTRLRPDLAEPRREPLGDGGDGEHDGDGRGEARLRRGGP